MTVIGYARASIDDHDLGLQEAALRAWGAEVIRVETTNGRNELKALVIRRGDTLLVTRLDRLARNMSDLQDIVRALRARGAYLKVTEQPIDTSIAAGKAFLDMLSVFAEFETSLRKERRLEGIARAKAAGVYIESRRKRAGIKPQSHAVTA